MGVLKHSLLFVMVILLASTSVPNQVDSMMTTETYDSLVQLSYSSRDRDGITIIDDGDTAWGDHVILNATFLLLNENVTGSSLYLLTGDSSNITISSANHTVVYDTHMIGKNATVAIQFDVTLENATLLSFHYDSITFTNYFRPHISEVSVSGAGAVKTIEWSMTDLNAGDNHIYDIFIRHHDNNRWWLWATNVTAKHIDWDMTFHYMGQWRVRVEVHDNDTEFHPTSVDSSTIWPSLEDSIDSAAFDGGTMGYSGSIPSSNVSIYRWGPSILNLTEGYTSQSISWIKRVSMFDAHPDFSDSTYYIFEDGNIVRTANISYGGISFALDGLSLGTHNITLYVTHKGFSAKDSVIVNILPDIAPFDYFSVAMIVFISIVALGAAVCITRDSDKT
ncbi:MAG: hypothetical protein ACFFEJ_19235 [Candidatus Thorarchaeota archaeon]